MRWHLTPYTVIQSQSTLHTPIPPMSCDVQFEVEQIISNVTKSSSGIFNLLQVPCEVSESISRPTATDNEPVRMKSNVYTLSTNESGNQKVKKLQSKRNRNAKRSAYQERMVASGEHCAPPSPSSSSTEQSVDVIIFEEDRKRSTTTRNQVVLRRCSNRLNSQRLQLQLSKGQMSDISEEPFLGFPLRTEDKKDFEGEGTSRAGSLTDNYLTSSSQTDTNDELYTIQPLAKRMNRRCPPLTIRPSEKNIQIKNHRYDAVNSVFIKPRKVKRSQSWQNEFERSVALNNKWKYYSEDLSKNFIKEEILKSNVIKSKTGFEQHEYHQCMSCKDRFLLQTGLTDHLDRSTVHIILTCQYCNTSIQFFNRCNLLQHLKDHQIIPTVDYLQQFTVTKPNTAAEYLIFDYGASSDDEKLTSPDYFDNNVCAIKEPKLELKPKILEVRVVITENAASFVDGTLKSRDQTVNFFCAKKDHKLELKPVIQETDAVIQDSNSKNTKNYISTVEAISKARTGDGVFRCLKCVETNFSTTNEDAFCAHVKSNHTWSTEELQQLFHKNGEITEFWCPECNDTFVTKLSLTRHLKAAHEFLHDISVYLEKLGYDGKIPLLENQCDECFLMFQQPSDLNKHLRTHGLAFLRQLKRLKLQCDM